MSSIVQSDLLHPVITRSDDGTTVSLGFFPAIPNRQPVLVGLIATADNAADNAFIRAGITQERLTAAFTSGGLVFSVSNSDVTFSDTDIVLIKASNVNADDTSAWALRTINGAPSSTQITVDAVVNINMDAGSSIWLTGLKSTELIGNATITKGPQDIAVAGNIGMPLVVESQATGNGRLDTSTCQYRRQ